MYVNSWTEHVNFHVSFLCQPCGLCKDVYFTYTLFQKKYKIRERYQENIHFIHSYTSKHSSRGSAPYPEALEIIKFPVAGDSFSRTESDCQGHKCRKTACFAPLDRLPSASALRRSSDGDLFILQSQFFVYTCKIFFLTNNFILL